MGSISCEIEGIELCATSTRPEAPGSLRAASQTACFKKTWFWVKHIKSQHRRGFTDFEYPEMSLRPDPRGVSQPEYFKKLPKIKYAFCRGKTPFGDRSETIQGSHQWFCRGKIAIFDKNDQVTEAKPQQQKVVVARGRIVGLMVLSRRNRWNQQKWAFCRGKTL